MLAPTVLSLRCGGCKHRTLQRSDVLKCALVGQRHFEVCEAAQYLTPKEFNTIAQGKKTRVVRAFVPPWVEETRDCRPSHQRCFGRRVTEAETFRGFLAASVTRRTKTDIIPRPPLPLSPNPGRRQGSQNSHCLALGYGVKPVPGKVMPGLDRHL